MDLAFILYLIGTFCSKEGSPSGFGFLGVVLLLFWLGMGLYVLLSTPKEREEFEPIRKRVWPLKVACVLLLTLAFILPSRETAYTMLAAYGVESLVANERVQELGGKSLDVLEKAMNDYLEEGE